MALRETAQERRDRIAQELSHLRQRAYLKTFVTVRDCKTCGAPTGTRHELKCDQWFADFNHEYHRLSHAALVALQETHASS